jgi:hypothetical protein
MDNLSLLDANKPEKIKNALNELIDYKNSATEIPNITAEKLGLGKVDNTSDKDKPVSTLQKEYIDEVNKKNVKLESSTPQPIDSDIILKEDKALYGERGNDTTEKIIGIKNENGYEAVMVGSKNIPLKLHHSVKDINDVEVSKNPIITIKNKDDTEEEDNLALTSDLQDLKTQLETKVSEKDNTKVDKTVLAGAETANGVVTDVEGDNFLNAQIDDMKLVLKVRSISDGALLKEVNIPIKLASTLTRGLMSKEHVSTLNDLVSKVASLEGQNARYFYTESSSPTQLEIDAFVQAQGKEAPYTGIAVVVDDTYHVWHYYENDNIGWRDDGVDTVSMATNTLLGIVKGSEIAGKIYVESDGSMSLVGYDNLVAKISSLEDSEIESISFAEGTENGTIKCTLTIGGTATTIDNIPVKGLGTAAYHNDAEYAKVNHTHSNYLTEHQDISGKENSSNKVSNITDKTSTTQYPSNKAVVDYVDSVLGNVETLLSEV